MAAPSEPNKIIYSMIGVSKRYEKKVILEEIALYLDRPAHILFEAVMADPSKAAAYNSLRKIRTLLGTAVSPNEQTRAHRANLIFIIDKALAVK